MHVHLNHTSAGMARRAALGVTGLLAAACGSTSTASPAPGTDSSSPAATAAAPPAGPPVALSLTARDFSFEPGALQAPSGAAVTLTFKNEGKAEHSFTPQGGIAVTQDAEGGKTETVTFTAPAASTIKFICKYHPTQMTGTLTITPAASATGAGAVPPPGPSGSPSGGQHAATTPGY